MSGTDLNLRSINKSVNKNIDNFQKKLTRPYKKYKTNTETKIKPITKKENYFSKQNISYAFSTLKSEIESKL